MKKQNETGFIGAILLLFGAVIFFKSTRIWMAEPRYFAGVSTTGILLALMLLMGIIMTFHYKPFMKYIMLGLLGVLIISAILHVRLNFHGTTLDVILMIIPLSVGAGLLLKYFVANRK